MCSVKVSMFDCDVFKFTCSPRYLAQVISGQTVIKVHGICISVAGMNDAILHVEQTYTVKFPILQKVSSI